MQRRLLGIFQSAAITVQTGKDFLAAGLGYAFLPRGIVKRELEEGLLAEVAPVGFSRMKLKSYRVCRAGEEERFF